MEQPTPKLLRKLLERNDISQEDRRKLQEKLEHIEKNETEIAFKLDSARATDENPTDETSGVCIEKDKNKIFVSFGGALKKELFTKPENRT